MNLINGSGQIFEIGLLALIAIIIRMMSSDDQEINRYGYFSDLGMIALSIGFIFFS